MKPPRPKALHTPVLLGDVLDGLSEISQGLFVDGTFGRGGHTRAILEQRPAYSVLALDCDAEAITYGRESFAGESRIRFSHAEFSNVESWAQDNDVAPNSVSGILLDLGVSSPQLDEGRRGFSFYHNGPLDMRMNASDSGSATAADIVNNWSEDELNDLFKEFGEVRSPYRVTRQIVEKRRDRPFSTTHELAELIAGADGWRSKGYHPATNYFMALRIQVNRELERLQLALPKLVELLAPHGRLLVITFHSLEDRIVKTVTRQMASDGLGRLVNKKVIQAEWSEKKDNPRARSAKLRIFAKGESADES